MELMVRDALVHLDAESVVMGSDPIELDLYEELVAFSRLSPEQQAEVMRQMTMQQVAERPASGLSPFAADLTEEQFLESAMAQLNARLESIAAEPRADNSGGGSERFMNSNNGSGSLVNPSGSLSNNVSPQPAAGESSGPLKFTGSLTQPASGTVYINCPACGSRSASNDIFCISCGSLLEE